MTGTVILLVLAWWFILALVLGARAAVRRRSRREGEAPPLPHGMGVGRSCRAAIRVGWLRVTWPLGTVVVTEDTVTGFAPFFRKSAYRRGREGLSDASFLAFRVHTQDIRDIRPCGFTGQCFIVTDRGGHSVKLLGPDVAGTLSALQGWPPS